MSHTETSTDRSLNTETGSPRQAHIIRATGGETAGAKILKARVEGTELEALCGHRFVPSRDSRNLPMCQECRNIYDLFRMFDGRYPEMPAD